jgi:hypothetical protein
VKNPVDFSRVKERQPAKNVIFAGWNERFQKIFYCPAGAREN